MKRSIVAFALLGGSAAVTCAQTPVRSEGGGDGSSVQQTTCDSCSAGDGGGGGPERGTGNQPDEAPAVFTEEPDTRQGAWRTRPGAGEFARPLYVGLAAEALALPFNRQYLPDYLALADIGNSSPAGSATDSYRSGGRGIDDGGQYVSGNRHGISAAQSYRYERIDGSTAGRAWGMSAGISVGPLTLRAAHQNRHVARIQLYDVVGNTLEARNSILAVNYRLSWGSAYAAYSVNRGWGSSPLFNPDNPYGAGIAATPSTDCRDILVGFAVPFSRSITLLASYIHKNDRELANRDANELAFGGTYTVARRTDFYAAYSHIRNLNEDGAAAAGPWGSTRRASSALNIGMRHAF